MYFCSGSKDLTFPSIMLMRLLHGTLLFSGKPPGSPPDSNLVRDISQHDAPSIDPGGMGALEGNGTTLEVLGRLKEEGDILPRSSLPTLISYFALWEENHGRNDLLTCTYSMGYFKEECSHMTDISVDRSSALSLWEIDPYWKSQLEGVIYYHGRIFLSGASKLKENLLQRAYE